jgi:hypothetical protein
MKNTDENRHDRKAHVSETARQERAQGGEPQANKSGDPHGAEANAHPENRQGADKATADNDLTTGRSAPDDGGADDAEH